MRRLSGRVADGALPLLYPPELFRSARADIVGALIEAGRSPTAFDLPACIWVSVGEPEAARRALAEKLAYYGPSISAAQLSSAGLTPADFEPAAKLAHTGDVKSAVHLISEQMLSLGVAGSVDDVVGRCLGLQEMGAEHISFGPPLGPDVLDAVELLGREVVPALGGRPGT